ncbi:MAG: PHP domain-containing protein [Chloroflexota bacterium]
MATDTSSSTGKIDLHLHTNASDGRLTPQALVELAHSRGVRRMALTDHDTTAGVPTAIATGARLGVEVIPGVELGTDSESGDLHMLGLFLDYHDARFQEVMGRFRDGRVERAKKIVRILNELGLTKVTYERVTEIAGEASIGRPHVAAAILENGYVDSMPEAFVKYLGNGMPADVPRDKFSPVEAIELIHSVGGLAVVAHPLEGKRVDGQIPELARAGLDGVECYYQSHGPEEVEYLVKLARQHGLVPTGGSDFHGFPLAGHTDVVNYPGSVNIPVTVLDELEQRRSARH